MAITFSDDAAERVRQFLKKDQGAAFRLAVKRTGCSGWAYVTSIAKQVESNDQQFEDQGIAIVVDPKSLELVDGTRIDFARKGLNQEFTFTNPNVTGECGCGESFAVNATDGKPSNPF